MRVDFYHLEKHPLEKALPQLLEKVGAAHLKTVIYTASQERVEYLDSLLWTYEPNSWLPHGSHKDGHADLQPVWLTAGEDNPNQATVAILVDGVNLPENHSFDRCLDMFDGNDPDAVSSARNRYKAARSKGHELHYWQQTAKGGWEEK